jgi:DNA-binding LytR/AlgR family response regulator
VESQLGSFEKASLMPINIVQIEDDKLLQDILKRSLKSHAAEINLQQFSNADSALAYLEHNGQPVDLFLIDVRLPGNIDGIEVARMIRDKQFSGAIVITSAFTSPPREMLEALQCEFVPKPWHVMDISRRLVALSQQPPQS